MNGIITDETEKEIGLIQTAINTLSTHILAVVVLAPTAWMMIQGVTIQEAWWTVVGGVVGYYFKK